MNYHDLLKMKVSNLRELAKEKTQLEGVSAMHKEQLVEALATALGIEKPHKVAHGESKTQLKQRIRALKLERDAAFASHEPDKGRTVRAQLHKLRRKLRQMASLEG